MQKSPLKAGFSLTLFAFLSGVELLSFLSLGFRGKGEGKRCEPNELRCGIHGLTNRVFVLLMPCGKNFDHIGFFHAFLVHLMVDLAPPSFRPKASMA
jgi:hypothetical protein